MSHVLLIGFMGSGKSTVGGLLAKRRGLPFVDLDADVERAAGQSISEIFDTAGEDAFRVAEHAALAGLRGAKDAVVACGGGIILRDENRALLRELGEVVYLAVSPEEALVRIGDPAGRPLLAGDAPAMARRILDARLSLYQAAADHVVDTVGKGADEVVDEVDELLRGMECATVHVSTSGGGYDVLIGSRVTESLGEIVSRQTGATSIALVSDDVVAGWYGERVTRLLVDSGLAVHPCVIDAGERSKTWDRAGEILERMAEVGLDRADAVVALGGGVVGDIAGLCAATYMRGIPLVQVPTTLVAQVDSSIGGKTAVDLKAGKNLAGAFWQPRAVVADIDLLRTLPESEWRNGLAEVVKTALLDGGEAVEALGADLVALLARDDVAVQRSVRACVEFKAAVVADDERESGRRECLNLGHTLGHAIELAAGFGTVPHGIAVAEGIRFAAGLAEEVLGVDSSVRRVQETLLDRAGLLPLADRPEADAIRRAMSADKKARGGTPRFVLLRDPGDWLVTQVDEDVLMRRLRDWSAGRTVFGEVRAT